MSKRQRTELSGPSELEKRLTNANSELQAENDDLKDMLEMTRSSSEKSKAERDAAIAENTSLMTRIAELEERQAGLGSTLDAQKEENKKLKELLESSPALRVYLQSLTRENAVKHARLAKERLCFADMPVDVIVLILRYLSFKDVLSCRLMGTLWASEEVANATADRNDEFDVKHGHWIGKRQKCIEEYTRLFGRGLTNLNFDYHVFDQVVLLTITPNLLRSVLASCPYANSTYLTGAKLTLDVLRVFFETTSITDITIQDCDLLDVTPDDLLVMLRGAPQIKELGLFDENHSVSFPSLADILDAAPNLEELYTNFTSEDVVTCLHGLRQLSMCCGELKDRHLLQISAHLHKLEEAEFAYSLDNVSPNAFLAFVRLTPTLKVASDQGVHEREDAEDGIDLTPDHPMWIKAQDILQERRGTPYMVWGGVWE
ncbi:hypothetical protein TrCOL_g135 [Triparma columacea]|uniref:F-box domain-containing protein n=1 Tax=Triparma columacea TaxID=722753 RepID=A0A9W7G8A1_9STRA|nr:hypothetical protein TrCOL_g135 [Triparma columacea]